MLKNKFDVLTVIVGSSGIIIIIIITYIHTGVYTVNSIHFYHILKYLRYSVLLFII